MFTNAETHEFIDLYKNEPVLWDPKHPKRRSKVDIIDAWIRIQKALSVECSVSDLKKKKEGLMATYRTCVQKRKADPNYKTSWFAFDQMDSFIAGRYSESNAKNDDLESSHLDAYFEEINNISGINQEVLSKTKDFSKKRKRIDIDSNDGYSTRDLEISAANQTSILQDDKDECDIYCQLLAIKLRKLNENERDLAMHEIDNLMFRAKIAKSKGRIQRGKKPVFVVVQEDQSESNGALKYEDDALSSD